MINEIAKEYADAARRVQLKNSDFDANRCLEDFNYFAEACFYDDDRKPIIQAPHHIHLQDIFDTHRRAVILYPVGFGKTTQIIMRILWELGRDPTLRIVVVSSKGPQAEKVVQAVNREMCTNPRVMAVFPDLKPALGAVRKSVDTWRGSALRVHGAPASQKDPSVAAYGIDGKISGSRVDLAFSDNICDFENTSSKHQRNKMLDRFTKEVMTRLIPKTGRCYITDTAWARDDMPHELMLRPAWHDVVFDATVNPFGKGVLWEERFPEKELDAIKGEIGTLAFDLTYRNIPMSDSMAIFKQSHIDQWEGTCEWREGYIGDKRVITGVDLAVQAGHEHDLTVFCTALDCQDYYELINIWAGQIAAGDILRQLVDIHERFHSKAGLGQFIVENNAAQEYIVQMAKDAAIMRAMGITESNIRNLNVTGRTTTSQKRDIEFGIPGVAADIEMGRWRFPKHDQFTALKNEMLDWIPDMGYHTGDRLMALWIARSQLAKPAPRVVTL